MDKAWLGPLEEVYRFLKQEGADCQKAEDGSEIFLLDGSPVISGIGGQEVVIKETVIYFVDNKPKFLAEGLRSFSQQGLVVGVF